MDLIALGVPLVLVLGSIFLWVVWVFASRLWKISREYRTVGVRGAEDSEL
jgi:hypothetical protein